MLMKRYPLWKWKVEMMLPAWEKLLQVLNTEEMGQTDIYNGLIYSFGADLKDPYEALANFEPDYGEYDLTDEQNTYKNIAIHLDSSGSMAAYVPGELRWIWLKTR